MPPFFTEAGTDSGLLVDEDSVEARSGLGENMS